MQYPSVTALKLLIATITHVFFFWNNNGCCISYGCTRASANPACDIQSACLWPNHRHCLLLFQHMRAEAIMVLTTGMPEKLACIQLDRHACGKELQWLLLLAGCALCSHLSKRYPSETGSAWEPVLRLLKCRYK